MEGGDNGGLLETGTLSVARFAGDGRGAWIELTPASTGMASQARVRGVGYDPERPLTSEPRMTTPAPEVTGYHAHIT